MLRWFLALACALVAVLAGPARAQDDYRVGPGDVLEVLIYGEEDLSGRFPVGADGTVDLPLLRSVPVAGRTVAEIAEDLTARLGRDYLVDPQVTVVVATYGSQKVQVLGAVKNPGEYALTGETTLLEVLAMAGGVTERSAGEVRVRSGDDEPPTVVSLQRLLAHGEGNRVVRSGDVVYVPESVFVYVAGEVNRPGPVPWRDGMTVSQAITEAGGASPTGDLRKVYLLRDGERIVINVRKVLRGRVEDVPVRPGDQVHVDRSVF